MTESYW